MAFRTVEWAPRQVSNHRSQPAHSNYDGIEPQEPQKFKGFNEKVSPWMPNDRRHAESMESTQVRRRAIQDKYSPWYNAIRG